MYTVGEKTPPNSRERGKPEQVRVKKCSWGRESPFDPLGQLYIGWEGGGNLAPAPWWVQYLQIGPWAAT